MSVKNLSKFVSQKLRGIYLFIFFRSHIFYLPFCNKKKKESREGEGSKPSIETMYSNDHTYILPYIYIVSI